MVKKELVEKLINLFKDYEREKMPPTKRVAAVLLPFVYSNGCFDVILTKRRSDLNAHGGEVSFPGGMMEESDSDLMHTALRETEEELGIKFSEASIICPLDDEMSKGGHRVTPFLAFIDESAVIVPSEDEVAGVYRVPVSHFFDDDVYWDENWVRQDGVVKVHFYRYRDDIIWGLTARILNKLFEIAGMEICD